MMQIEEIERLRSSIGRTPKIGVLLVHLLFCYEWVLYLLSIIIATYSGALV